MSPRRRVSFFSRPPPASLLERFQKCQHGLVCRALVERHALLPEGVVAPERFDTEHNRAARRCTTRGQLDQLHATSLACARSRPRWRYGVAATSVVLSPSRPLPPCSLRVILSQVDGLSGQVIPRNLSDAYRFLSQRSRTLLNLNRERCLDGACLCSYI
jgi:hypothetical protein